MSAHSISRLAVSEQECDKGKKKEDGNLRRINSMISKAKTMNTKKAIVRQALYDLDKAPTLNKKIRFDCDEAESDSESNENTLLEKTTRKGHALFQNNGEDDDGDDADDSNSDSNMFRVRPQYEGAEGKKMLKLQTRIGTDHRFRLDSRFAEEGEENKEEVIVPEVSEEKSELLRNMQILGNVVGHNKVARLNSRSHKKSFKDTMLIRFDPTNKDHEQFEIKIPVVTKPQPEKKKREKSKENTRFDDTYAQCDPIVLPAPDKRQFHEVDSTLVGGFTQSAILEEQPFSMLAMFGDNRSNYDSDSEDAELYVDTTTVKVSLNNEDRFNDSGASDDESKTKNVLKPDPNISVTVTPKRHSFFFTPTDERLQDGLSCFKIDSNDKRIARNWSKVRPKLQHKVKWKQKNLSKQLKPKKFKMHIKKK